MAHSTLISSKKQGKPFRKPKNIDVRSREYLRVDEVERLLTAVKNVGRHRQRDELMILMQYRHGLRVSELCRLRWSDVDWSTNHVYVRRLKNGKDSNQPIEDVELDLLKKYQQQVIAKLRRLSLKPSPYMFLNERKVVIDDESIRFIIKRAGELADFDFPLHPHMLRHSCGYYLAAKGYNARVIQDYLGHRNINHIVPYTELAPGQFNGLWK